ncbi:hypothetical protein EBZ39_05625 [bacterium]|nr:hypothetical protein [bacterium]
MLSSSLKKGSSLFGIVLLVLAAGCAKYTPQALPRIQADEKNASKQSGVTGYAYELTPAECKKAFSRDASKHGLTAVHLTLSNHSNDTYIFSGQHIGAPVESRQSVADTLKIDVAQRVLSWTVPGLFIGLFLIPAVYEWAASSRANTALAKDFATRVIGSEATLQLPPGGTISKVFFVRTDALPHRLSLKLENMHTRQFETVVVPLHP